MGLGVGESAEEEAAVRATYEPFGEDGVAFIVDLEAAVVHQLRPGALHDPTLGQGLETSGVDLGDHLDGDVVTATMIEEAALESGVAPQLAKPPGSDPGPLGDLNPSGVVHVPAATTVIAIRRS